MWIQHKRTTQLWPQANGKVERQNRSLMKRIKIAQSEKKNWKEEPDAVSISATYSYWNQSSGVDVWKEDSNQNTASVWISQWWFWNWWQEFRAQRKRKEYSAMKRGSTESNIPPGNKVLVKQKQNHDKMTPTFRPESMTVKAKYGNTLCPNSLKSFEKFCAAV